MDDPVLNPLELFLSVVTEVLDGISDIVDTISGEALLLIPIACAFVALVIGLCFKLMRQRGRR